MSAGQRESDLAAVMAEMVGYIGHALGAYPDLPSSELTLRRAELTLGQVRDRLQEALAARSAAWDREIAERGAEQ